MEDKAIKPTYENFLADVPMQAKPWLDGKRKQLLDRGYREKVMAKTAGYTLSYASPATKRSFLNLLFQKGLLIFRIYLDHLAQYEEFLSQMPPAMIKMVEKSHICKQLAYGGGCSDSCVKGYDFMLQGERYQKCRYQCFEFPVNEESLPVLTALFEKELEKRDKQDAGQ